MIAWLRTSHHAVRTAESDSTHITHSDAASALTSRFEGIGARCPSLGETIPPPPPERLLAMGRVVVVSSVTLCVVMIGSPPGGAAELSGCSIAQAITNGKAAAGAGSLLYVLTACGSSIGWMGFEVYVNDCVVSGALFRTCVNMCTHTSKIANLTCTLSIICEKIPSHLKIPTTRRLRMEQFAKRYTCMRRKPVRCLRRALRAHV